mgnify:CR=1 FL=1
MASTFLLKIVTPSHDVYNGEVEKVFLKNAYGDLEILANHENMITSTVPCIAKFKDAKGNDEELFISTATAHVSKEGMIICSDAAEFESDIDEERAKQAMERAEKRLNEADKYNKERAESALLRAKERLALKKSRK